MLKYLIDKENNKLVFEGKEFNLSEIEKLLKKAGYDLLKTRTCPAETILVITEPAKNLLRIIMSGQK